MSNDNEIRDAYIAGFMASTEGHNGEFVKEWANQGRTPREQAERQASQYLEHEHANRSAIETERTSDAADFIRRIVREHGRGMEGFRAFRSLWGDITGERLGLKEAHTLWAEHR